jgi:hypothetical protein
MTRSDPTLRRYERPRRPFSLAGALFGLALGLALGLLVSWVLFPTQQVDVAPWQIRADDRMQYLIAIGLAFSADSDLDRAVERLITLRLPGDPFQALADAACQLTTTGYVKNTSGLRAVRSMMALYQSQGRSGCADGLISAEAAPTTVVEVSLPTPTPLPVATKTATPQSALLSTPTPLVVAVPTAQRVDLFEAISVTTSCSAAQGGRIEAYVYELNGSTGVPGQPIRVRWSGGESTFYTGLLPERGAAYADFVMTEGVEYRVDMPGRAEPITTALAAVPCVDPTTGERAITTYRVIFRALQ